MINDMIYMLTAIGLPPGGSSTVHIYTQTIHRTTQLTTRTTQFTTRTKQFTTRTTQLTTWFGRQRSVLRLCELYPGICRTSEEKAQKNISQGSRRVSVGTMETECTEQNVHNNKNT